MRIMITGARGQLGHSLRQHLPEDWELIATDSRTLDITNREAVQSMIDGFQPDAIVNAAAYTDVNGAEQHPELAFAVNAQGVRNLAVSAQQNGARLIQLSTDYVFDGKRKKPYIELDSANPLNAYGRSKLAGETLALAINPHTLVIRTSAIFSEQGRSFVSTVLQKAQAGEVLHIPDNQYTCPTYAGSLAQAIIHILRDYGELRGILNYCGDTAWSWYMFARQILTLAGLDTSLLQIENTPSPTSACRPAYSVLDTQLAKQYVAPSETEKQLALCIQHLMQK